MVGKLHCFRSKIVFIAICWTLVALLTQAADAVAQVQWQSLGPGGGGWLTVMTIDPNNSQIIYLGCDVGGVYRSGNGGQTWTIKNQGLAHYSIDDILIDSTQPARIFLATNGGVYRSDDAAATWVLKRQGFPPVDPLSDNAPVACLTQPAANPSVIYACFGLRRYYSPGDIGNGKIYASYNSGEIWSVLNPGGDIPTTAMFFSLAADPVNPSILYAATNLGLYKSTNAGLNWTKKAAELPYDHVRDVVIDPTNTSRI